MLDREKVKSTVTLSRDEQSNFLSVSPCCTLPPTTSVLISPPEQRHGPRYRLLPAPQREVRRPCTLQGKCRGARCHAMGWPSMHSLPPSRSFCTRVECTGRAVGIGILVRRLERAPTQGGRYTDALGSATRLAANDRSHPEPVRYTPEPPQAGRVHGPETPWRLSRIQRWGECGHLPLPPLPPRTTHRHARCRARPPPTVDQTLTPSFSTAAAVFNRRRQRTRATQR